eukprot:jgi/Galph1/816/GphlegSOOS_G5511.1
MFLETPLSPMSWITCCAKTFGFCLAQLPALSRRWFTDSVTHELKNKVEGFVRKYVSPSIIEREFDLLKTTLNDTEGSGNLKLKPIFVTREVFAVYSFTDTTIEIVLRLPEDFPLRLVQVEAKTAIGMPEAKWRKTVLAMCSLLSMKDGNLREAIDIWRCSLDKQFEGIEECPICYTILHMSNGTLPRLGCLTCKHKFHAAWYVSSLEFLFFLAHSCYQPL